MENMNEQITILKSEMADMQEENEDRVDTLLEIL